jgi:hypothetical protein
MQITILKVRVRVHIAVLSSYVTPFLFKVPRSHIIKKSYSSSPIIKQEENDGLHNKMILKDSSMKGKECINCLEIK